MRRVLLALAAMLIALPIALSDNLIAESRADVDTDFAAALHGFGIYGPRDYNAWLAKITCKRLTTGVDAGVRESSEFLSANLARSTSTAQVWQFLGTGLQTYCPEHLGLLNAMSDNRAEGS